MLQNQILNLRQELAKKPKMIKIETYKTLNTTIEPGDVKGILDKERQEKSQLEEKVRNLESLLNQFELFKNQNKSVKEIFEQLKRDLETKDREISSKNSEINRLKSHLETPSQLQQIEAEMEQSNKELMEKSQKLGLAEINQKSLEKIIENLRQQIDTLQRENQQLNSSLSKEKSDLIQQLNNFKDLYE